MTRQFSWVAVLLVGGTAMLMLLVALLFVPLPAWESFVPLATLVAVLGALVAAVVVERTGWRLVQPLRKLARSIEAGQIGDLSLDDFGRQAPAEVAPLLYGLQLTHAQLRRTLAELEQDRGELRRAEAARRDFVANVSHELRTPVAALKALVETLERGAIDDPVEGPEFLRLMHTEVDGLAQLVAELLELARAEAGRLELQLAPCRADELVREAAERARPSIHQADLLLDLSLPSEADLWVNADSRRIGQVLSNLLANATKFTPPAGRIEVGARGIDGRVELWVSDTGVGIDPALLPRVFERFYKTDPSRAAGTGTGLGLAIAKHLVLAHDGQIWAESPGPGLGATFRVALPRLGPAHPSTSSG